VGVGGGLVKKNKRGDSEGEVLKRVSLLVEWPNEGTRAGLKPRK